MLDNSQPKYTMTMSLNVLNHLGIGLYSNVPAVLSETIANAWDADAEHVDIQIDTNNQRVTILDDGHGMSVSDANDKYLNIGYERRKSGEEKSPGKRRPVMGRKGIGKLSLFSIADVVEVHSVKNGELHGFRMSVDAIKQTMASDDGTYYPETIDVPMGTLDKGTRIILTDMKRGLRRYALKRRLARRFSIMGSNTFTIKLNDEEVTVADRGYHDKLQYIWTFGQMGEEVAELANNREASGKLSSSIEVDGETYEIDGWIGTAWKPSDLKDSDSGESINGIVIMVRGKLAQENILDEFGDQNLYSEYVLGEIHADFLDMDDQEDIATTSRQRLIEDDPRYEALKQSLREHLATIQKEWRKHRDTSGTEVATIIPQIAEWYESLNQDQKRNAKKLFGRINQLPIADETEKRRIFVGAILAFESLKFRNMLSRLDNVSTENIGALAEVFEQLDDIEQSAYYQITKERLDVIRTLTNLVDDNAKEKALQEHLHKHPWLLDPSWERATYTRRMETTIHKALGVAYESMSAEAQGSRLDIYYVTTSKKHVIIELKRADRKLHTSDIYDQIQKYRTQVLDGLRLLGRENEPLEIICVLGRSPYEWDASPNEEQLFRASLKIYDARIVMYDELIQNALEAYQDYVDQNEEAGRVYQLVRSIAEEDFSAMHPSDPPPTNPNG